MTSPCQSSKVLWLLVASCLAWIGSISLAVVCLAGTAVSTGWIIAGALVFALVTWVLVMAREIRDAIELPDFSAYGERGDGNFDQAGKSTKVRPRSEINDRSLMGRRGMTPARGGKTRRRKVRSKFAPYGSQAGR